MYLVLQPRYTAQAILALKHDESLVLVHLSTTARSRNEVITLVSDLGFGALLAVIFVLSR
jgi:hypothetical protein